MPTLLCDVGGVLIENPWVKMSEEIGRKLGVDPGEVLRLLMGLSRRLDSGELALRQFHHALVAALGADYPFPQLEERLDAALKKNRAVWDSVQELGRTEGWQVVALSNMSRAVWGSLQRKFGIGALFASVVLSFEHGVLKPDPAIYALALKQAKARADECIFVDDVEENVEAAASLGITPYLARRPRETADFIRSLGTR